MRKPDAASVAATKASLPAGAGRCAGATGLPGAGAGACRAGLADRQRSGDAAGSFPDCSFLIAKFGRCSDSRVSSTGMCNPMILDIARLLLFPALMAFAAASDLFTMTISNRVSLALVAGFLVLAVAERHGTSRHPFACRRRRRRAGGSLCLLCDGLDRRRRRQGSGRRGALVRLRPSAELPGLCLAVRRRPDAAAAPVPAMAAALRRSPARPGCSSCTPRTAAFPTASRSRSAH